MQTIDKASILMDQVLFLLLVGELGDRWMMCKICFWQKCTENPNWYLKDKAALVVQVGFVCSGGGVMRTDAANKICRGRGLEKLESDGNGKLQRASFEMLRRG